jgi:hypothetical protein
VLSCPPDFLVFLSDYWYFKDLYNATLNDRRGVTANTFVALLIDTPFIILFILTLPFAWRIPNLLYDLLNEFDTRTTEMRRSAIWQNFARAFLDPIALCCSVFLLVTVYRLPSLKSSLFGPQSINIFASYQPTAVPAQPSLSASHILLLEEFGNLFLDLPFLFFGFILFVTGIRAKVLWDLLVLGPSASERRWGTFVQFCNLLLDLPFILVALIVTVIGAPLTLLVRPFLLWRDLWNLSTASDRRLCTIVHLLLLILDCFAIPSALLLTYRLPETKYQLSFTRGFLALYDPQVSFEEVSRPHFVVFSQFIGLLCDLPFIPMALCVFLSHRSCTLYSFVASPPFVASQRRYASLKQFFLLLLDLITLPFLLIVFFTGIRSVSLIHELHGWSAEKKEREARLRAAQNQNNNNNNQHQLLGDGNQNNDNNNQPNPPVPIVAVPVQPLPPQHPVVDEPANITCGLFSLRSLLRFSHLTFSLLFIFSRSFFLCFFPRFGRC